MGDFLALAYLLGIPILFIAGCFTFEQGDGRGSSGRPCLQTAFWVAFCWPAIVAIVVLVVLAVALTYNKESS